MHEVKMTLPGPGFPIHQPGVPASRGGIAPDMERNVQEQLKAHLMESDPQFRQLAAQHGDYARKLDALEALPHLTEEEQIEEVRLKKMKLRLKDQMEAIMSQHRAHPVV
jgi:uncharacterized protein